MFANIDTKKILFNKIFKTLTKIVAIYISTSFLIEKIKFSIRTKV